MWFGQTGLNLNQFETGLSASVNGANNTLVPKNRMPSQHQWLMCTQCMEYVLLFLVLAINFDQFYTLLLYSCLLLELFRSALQSSNPIGQFIIHDYTCICTIALTTL